LIKKNVLSGDGWMDDFTKGYNKTKSIVKSKTGQKIKKLWLKMSL
jgi:hypothetical protein